MNSKLITIRKGHPRSIYRLGGPFGKYPHMFNLGGDTVTTDWTGGGNDIYAGDTSILWVDTGGVQGEVSGLDLNIEPLTISQSSRNSYNVGGSKSWSTAASIGTGLARNIPTTSFSLNGKKFDRGAWDLLDPTYYMANGRTSKVGNTLSDTGVLLTKSGNPWMMLAGAGLKIAGSFANAGWGVKANQGNIDAINRSTQRARTMSNVLSGSSGTSDLLANASYMQNSLGFNTKDLYSRDGWFVKGKAKKEGMKLLNKNNAALASQSAGLQSGILRIERSNRDALARSYITALGGPLHTFDKGGKKSSPWDNTSQRDLPPSVLLPILEERRKAKLRAQGKLPPEPGVFGGGSFEGSGTSGHFDVGDTFPEARNFNEAYDMAVDRKLNEFVFNNKRYNTDKENNPIREINNRIAGSLRKFDEKADTVYDRKPYVVGTMELNIPLITKRNFKAFGGYYDNVDPLTAVGYELYTDKFVKDNNKNNNEGMANLFAGVPNSMFAFGGDVLTHGGTWLNTTHVNTGGSHEENSEDGVQVGVDKQGVPNLVEEGEVIFKDYVFSNRLTVPKHKYAKGGKLKKDEIPYEQLVLRPYEGLTFAEAAKRIEKKSGAADRPIDPIAQRGMANNFEEGSQMGPQGALGVLRDVLEKEREIEKLQEALKAIEQMSPEEFAALQQEVQASQEEQAAAEAQQQLIEAEQMAQQQGVMQPLGVPQGAIPADANAPVMAALGGELDTVNTEGNLYEYGGNLAALERDLKPYGITLKDFFVEWLMHVNKATREEAEATYEHFKDNLTGDTNDYDKDFAETFLKRAETLSKLYEREAKRKGIKVDRLLGRAASQFRDEQKQAIRKGIQDNTYSISKDPELSFNSSTVARAGNKGKQEAYTLSALVNNLIGQGAKVVSTDDTGRPIWNKKEGLTKIDRKIDGADVDESTFYGGLGELDEDARGTRGIYNYKKAKKSGIDVENFEDVKNGLHGWIRGTDGKFIVNTNDFGPNQTSIGPGNSNTTYPIADIPISADEVLSPNDSGYTDAIKAIQEDEGYRNQTKYVLEAIANANGDVAKLAELNPDVLNYLKYLDKYSGNKEGKLLKDDGTLSETAYNDYLRRREDNDYGIYHYLFDLGNNAAADRYYYMDNGNKVYILKPEGEDFKIGDTAEKVTGADGTEFNDYEVTGANLNRRLVKMPTGEILDVTGVEDPDLTAASKPVIADNTDNLGYGITGKTDWANFKDTYNPDDYDPFPKSPWWPYAAGLGLQGAGLLWNIFNKPDNKYANALLKASEGAGKFMPIEYRPTANYLRFKSGDPWRYIAPMTALTNAVLRNSNNRISPSAGAENVANLYNYNNALGNAAALFIDADFNREAKVAAHNEGIDESNSRGFLQADMANQQAASRSKGFELEGKKAAYAMMYDADKNWSANISNNLTGIGNLLYNWGSNKYNQDVLGWRARRGVDGPGIYFNAKGGKVKRRKKGLSL